MARRWTPEDFDRVEEMRMEGMTVAEIAATIGRSYAAVKHHIEAQQPPLLNCRMERYVLLFTKGHSNREVAELMGISFTGSVRRIKTRLKKLGLLKEET